MAPLIPTSSSCHALKLPPVEADDRLNLNVRTGSCSTLLKSMLFTHGGLSIGLELYNFTIHELENILNSKINASASASTFDSYLSGEFFYLNIIEREWFRVRPTSKVRPKPRLFHEIVAFRNKVYLFGGLVLSSNTPNKFKPTNDLWEFDLDTKEWKLINDGNSSTAAAKRFGHNLIFLNELSLLGQPNHIGLMILGGKDLYSEQIEDSCIFDLVEMKYYNLGRLIITEEGTQSSDEGHRSVISFNSKFSTVLTYDENSKSNNLIGFSSSNKKSPLIQFTKSIFDGTLNGTRLPMKTINKSTSSNTYSNAAKYQKVPYSLNYPNSEKFGQNIVLIGFLPNDYDISIFIYHKPTSKWSRLKIFCHHEFGAHRLWGGFVWGSHHKVVLIGNYVTSRTSSNIRFFTQMITVSLPITNISASSEVKQSSNYENLDFANEKKKKNNVSFADYAHYAAPKTKFSSISSVFPPAAVTLGRNAFERYGNLISDFEFISADGEKIPVPMILLRKRWGRVFDMILAKSYVRAIEKFRQNQLEYSLIDSKDSASLISGSSNPSNTNSEKLILPPLVKPTTKEAPQFRLPFQDSVNTQTKIGETNSVSSSPLPAAQSHSRKNSLVSTSSLSTSSDQNGFPSFNNLPPQLPLPNAPIPDLPSQPSQYSHGYSHSRSYSQLSNKFGSESPLPSPRASIVGKSPIRFKDQDSENSSLRRSSQSSTDEKDNTKSQSSQKPPSQQNSQSHNSISTHNYSVVSEKSSIYSTLKPHLFTNSVLNFDDPQNFKLESLLIPRRLYFPFSTPTVRAFIEYLYTGQVGNKWTIAPVTLDVLLMSKYYEVPLLYDLILEVLYGIIGRKESFVIEEFKNLQFKYILLCKKTKSDYVFKSALEEFKGFMETVEDGYLDSFILQKANRLTKKSNHHFSVPKPYISKKVEDKSDDDKKSSDEDGIELIAFVDSSMPGEEPSRAPGEGEAEEGIDAIHKNLKSSEDIRQPKESTTSRSSRSENEKSKLSNVPTLEQLSSSESSIPSDIIIDFIYETSVLANDMKLMLRSSNVREMTKIYNSEKDELIREIGRLEKINEKINPNLDKPRRNLTGGVSDITSSDDREVRELNKTLTDFGEGRNNKKTHLHNLHNLPIFSHRKDKKS